MDSESAARPKFWTLSPQALCASLTCGTNGLTAAEARQRQQQYGPNSLAQTKIESWLHALVRRLLEPLSLILLAAGFVSIVTGDEVGGGIIVMILALSIGLDTVQEGHAIKAADMLRRSVATRAEVKRDGVYLQVAVEDVVPGDLVRVRAGDIVPADALVLESAAFTAGEASLTGEPYPVEKRPLPAPSATGTSNALFRGSVALTGEAVALVAGTGRNTMFGAAAAALSETQAPSPFQRDLHDFGLAIARLTLGLVVVVLAMRVLFGRDLLGSLMFSVALAVGLTPELLPMITTVTLSRGAVRMSRRKVIVKRLTSIHDLGAMTVLCTDKTGTLTSAEIRLERSLGPDGQEDARASRLAAIAADLGGDRGALDAALLKAASGASQGWSLEARRSFDFMRRTGSILARGPEGDMLIVKGTPDAVLALCTTSRSPAGVQELTPSQRNEEAGRVRAWALDGLRTIAVASRVLEPNKREIAPDDEKALVFEGFCTFADPPKETAKAAIERLARAGVRLKVLSGDDPCIVQHIAGLVGLETPSVLTGDDVNALSDDALAVKAQSVDAFGRLAPDQKSRIVKALQARGSVVGFLGDGINDAPGLKAADIGISVDGATGVAQAAADIILLASDLEVVANGVEEGRRTFVNILKYVRMGASSNFGNMLSMAVASIFLPFLPMLPTQILLNNLLYDFSEIGIPFDAVRADATARPQQWDMRALIRFASVMGPLSSLFDAATFAVLLLVFRASVAQFQTAWFLESMMSQILVIFIIRTNGRPWRDAPGYGLVASTLLALAIAVIVPFTIVGSWFGFDAPNGPMLSGIVAIVALYLVAAEITKRWVIDKPVAVP